MLGKLLALVDELEMRIGYQLHYSWCEHIDCTTSWTLLYE